MNTVYGPQEATVADADRLAEESDAVAETEGLNSPRAGELTMDGLTTLSAAWAAQERHGELEAGQ